MAAYWTGIHTDEGQDTIELEINTSTSKGSSALFAGETCEKMKEPLESESSAKNTENTDVVDMDISPPSSPRYLDFISCWERSYGSDLSPNVNAASLEMCHRTIDNNAVYSSGASKMVNLLNNQKYSSGSSNNFNEVHKNQDSGSSRYPGYIYEEANFSLKPKDTEKLNVESVQGNHISAQTDYSHLERKVLEVSSKFDVDTLKTILSSINQKSAVDNNPNVNSSFHNQKIKTETVDYNSRTAHKAHLVNIPNNINGGTSSIRKQVGDISHSLNNNYEYQQSMSKKGDFSSTVDMKPPLTEKKILNRDPRIQRRMQVNQDPSRTSNDVVGMILGNMEEKKTDKNTSPSKRNPNLVNSGIYPAAGNQKSTFSSGITVKAESINRRPVMLKSGANQVLNDEHRKRKIETGYIDIFSDVSVKKTANTNPNHLSKSNGTQLPNENSHHVNDLSKRELQCKKRNLPHSSPPMQNDSGKYRYMDYRRRTVSTEGSDSSCSSKSEDFEAPPTQNLLRINHQRMEQEREDSRLNSSSSKTSSSSLSKTSSSSSCKTSSSYYGTIIYNGAARCDKKYIETEHSHFRGRNSEKRAEHLHSEKYSKVHTSGTVNRLESREQEREDSRLKSSLNKTCSNYYGTTVYNGAARGDTKYSETEHSHFRGRNSEKRGEHLHSEKNSKVHTSGTVNRLESIKDNLKHNSKNTLETTRKIHVAEVCNTQSRSSSGIQEFKKCNFVNEKELKNKTKLPSEKSDLDEISELCELQGTCVIRYPKKVDNITDLFVDCTLGGFEKKLGSETCTIKEEFEGLRMVLF